MILLGKAPFRAWEQAFTWGNLYGINTALVLMANIAL